MMFLFTSSESFSVAKANDCNVSFGVCFYRWEYLRGSRLIWRFYQGCFHRLTRRGMEDGSHGRMQLGMASEIHHELILVWHRLAWVAT